MPSALLAGVRWRGACFEEILHGVARTGIQVAATQSTVYILIFPEIPSSDSGKNTGGFLARILPQLDFRVVDEATSPNK